MGSSGGWQTVEEDCTRNDGSWRIGNEVEGALELLKEVVVLSMIGDRDSVSRRKKEKEDRE